MTLLRTGEYLYTTREGDMFDMISMREYNEERMSHHIMAENPDFIDTVIFPAGVTLVIPRFDFINTPETMPPWRREQ